MSPPVTSAKAMIPPKAVLLAELERVLPKAAAKAAVEDAMKRADGSGAVFPRHLERALSRHLAEEDVQEVLGTLGYGNVQHEMGF